MTEELATTDPTAAELAADKLPPLPILNGVTALVRKPEDVEEANSVILAWVTKQISGLKKELAIAEENLEHAVKRKLKQGGWKRQVKLWQNRVVYYEKMQSALEQGYFIMPDLPNVIDVFAVRTKQRNTNQSSSATYKHGSDNGIMDVKSQALPEGDGRYVNPAPLVERYSEEETYKNHSGNEATRTRYFSDTAGLSEVVDFPVVAVRPQVLDATGMALAAKLFDEIGIIRPHSGATRKGDPIVVGRIRNGDEKACSFIIHWWVATEDL